jgi:hypothetical protein
MRPRQKQRAKSRRHQADQINQKEPKNNENTGRVYWRSWQDKSRDRATRRQLAAPTGSGQLKTQMAEP